MNKKIIKYQSRLFDQEITMTIDDSLKHLPEEVKYTSYREEVRRHMAEMKNLPAMLEAMGREAQ